MYSISFFIFFFKLIIEILSYSSFIHMAIKSKFFAELDLIQWCMRNKPSLTLEQCMIHLCMQYMHLVIFRQNDWRANAQRHYLCTVTEQNEGVSTFLVRRSQETIDCMITGRPADFLVVDVEDAFTFKLSIDCDQQSGFTCKFC